MTRYEVTTINKTLVTLLDEDLARIFFEQHKDKYSYLELKKVTVNDIAYTSVSLDIHY